MHVKIFKKIIWEECSTIDKRKFKLETWDVSMPMSRCCSKGCVTKIANSYVEKKEI